MSYLPRPDANRASSDIDLIYALTAEALQRAVNAAARREAFHTGLLRAFEAGIDAQREILQRYPRNQPTPFPDESESPVADDDPTDPCILPPPPSGVFKPKKRS